MTAAYQFAYVTMPDHSGNIFPVAAIARKRNIRNSGTPTITWEALEPRSRLLGMDIYKSYTVAMLDIRSGTSSDATRSYARPEDLHEMRDGLILRTLQSHLRDNMLRFCYTAPKRRRCP